MCVESGLLKKSMEELKIRFDDGAAYEDFMGKWSQIAGDTFLDWLAPTAGSRWIDVGCGNGAFTEMLIRRCSPASVQGIDPSEAQLNFARARFATNSAQFELGDAMLLPYTDGTFDAAVMALVIFFVPDPVKGVAEMARIVRAGGSVSAYAWDILGGGFPFAPMQEEMAALGSPPLWPPSVNASRIDTMHELWTGAGLVEVAAREISVQRTFADFDSFWKVAQTGPGMGPRIATMLPRDLESLKDRLRARLAPDADGRITCSARANVVKGRVPG